MKQIKQYNSIRPGQVAAKREWNQVGFDGEMAYLDWHDEWKIEDYE